MPHTPIFNTASSPSSAQAGSSAASGLDFAALLNASPDAIIVYDRDFRILYANPQAIRISQFDANGSIGKIYWDIRPESRGTILEENFLTVMRHRASRQFEFYCAPIGVWMDVLVMPFADGVAVFYKDISVAKLARETRDAATKRLQQMFDAMPDSIVCLDRAWNFTFANWRAVDMFASGPLTGENFWNCLHHSLQEPFSSNYRRAMELRVPTEFEAYYPGSVNLWLNVQSIPSDDGIIIFFRNITERRQGEEALRESEERYRALIELNPQAIWMSDAHGKITYANRGFSDYLGFTTADLDHWITAFHPDDRTRILETWGDCVSKGAEYDTEARLIRARDGQMRWWWIRARPIRDASGAVLHWLGVAIDIHDRKTFAETLLQKQVETERQRAELETIYDTAPVGLALFDPIEFRYLRVNDHQAAVIGLPKDRILGRSILEIAPLEGLKELFQQVAAGHAVRNYILEGELPTRPGQHRFWSVNYSPVYGTDEKIEAIAAVVVEVTHQKKAENALIQSEKLAAVGRLASSISHEINNPLEAITNLLYLIALTDDLSPSARAYVQTAQSELSRVCQIATQTLRFHRQAVRATNVTAADLVNAVLNLYQGRLANSNIKVEACYATTTRILCFENDIRQVLNNLIANAIDAMRQGGRLIIRAHDATDDSSGKSCHGIRITIADTGHGMSAEVRARLFEPFYTTKDLNGTGLGLWISAGIVRRHQGRLSFRSTQHPVHHGTIFSLFLPWAEEPSPPVS